MRGKYSPTVTAAYMADQDWFEKNCAPTEIREGIRRRAQYDRDGFDSYGYNADEVDRAGNQEHDYYPGWTDEQGDYHEENDAYDQALRDWGFDGVKPALKG